MKVQSVILISEDLLSTVDQLLEKDKTRSDFVEAALSFYIAQLRRVMQSDRDIGIINRNADYLYQETQDALEYQVKW